MRESWSLGRVAGIRVGMNWSLLVVVWLISWSLAGSLLPEIAPGHSTLGYWIVGAVDAVAFFACLLAHELAHSLVARRHGVEVKAIVLWLLGGVSQLEGEAHDARTELRIALAGPATSAALGATLLMAAGRRDALVHAPLITAGLGWLGAINGMLAAFNLLPAFPLDGGRVLRAWMWKRGRDKVAATVRAAQVGRVIAYGLMALGALEMMAGGVVCGGWLLFLAWFLVGAAGAEAARSILDERFGAVPIAELMTPAPVTVPPGTTVAELLDGWMFRHRCSTFPVVDDAGRLRGLVTMARVKPVPPERRYVVGVLDVACPPEQVVTCAPRDPAAGVMARMNASPDQRAVVLDGGRVVGIVSPSDVARSR